MRSIDLQPIHRRDKTCEPREADAGEDAVLEPRDHGLVDPGRTLQVTL
jgi:hypothetical protein